MIISFKHKGLKQYYLKGDKSKLSPTMINKIQLILSVLDVVKCIEDLNNTSFKTHPLIGERLGQISITVRANWRIVFRIENENIYDVDFVDYH
ncbi:MAG: type II toxin-antitoxin system RelE/ParE family toxin [OCS116 cluster bacterium]|nr:type II toxin-antitoxin system RelE/ParE family toxin [OCS116 cluster bacterium]